METQAIAGQAETADSKIGVIQVIKPDTEPLDTLYALSPKQAPFFKAETGIDNDDDLRTHILQVQEKAYKIFPYMCIRWFTFLQLEITTLLEYERIIKLGQERPDGILLDVGCCFGVDARKAVADGFPLKNVVTADLYQEFLHLGHALFNTTPETYPINFVVGDVFDPDMLQILPPFDQPPSTEKPDLSALTSLNPLAGRCAVIYASNFFHLFSEEKQLVLAKALAGLLSCQPGSMICGEHVGNRQKGIFNSEKAGRVIAMFQHCPESWIAMWDQVFAKEKVRSRADVHQAEKNGLTFYRLQWSVVRL